MKESDPTVNPTSSGPEAQQEPDGMDVVGLYGREEANAMELAAAEIDSDITVDVIDPSDDTEFGRYADALSVKEHAEHKHSRVYLSKPGPRSPEEITRTVQPHVIKQGLTPVIVRRTRSDLDEFWSRQQEILAKREEE